MAVCGRACCSHCPREVRQFGSRSPSAGMQCSDCQIRAPGPEKQIRVYVLVCTCDLCVSTNKCVCACVQICVHSVTDLLAAASLITYRCMLLLKGVV